ncbi:hypothetical protein PR002_g32964 [Phytophthora rubi]|uniref:Pectate lyase n=1 Tax=Phytophthora rubi TaxID=129364 RepID=A0A6A3G469_9STRA|nr:hypothetical protein PR002_g32964 [Phytophthora rubi]
MVSVVCLVIIPRSLVILLRTLVSVPTQITGDEFCFAGDGPQISGVKTPLSTVSLSG